MASGAPGIDVPNPIATTFDARHSKVMIVDDEPANLKLFSLMLRSDGYRDVVCIQDPRDVAEACRRDRPDLVLLDLNMPELDGYGVMAALKALGDPAPPPVVVLTAQSGEDFLLRALDAGATDFLSKPIGKRVLLARVRNVLLAHLAHRSLLGKHSVLEQMVGLRTQELRQSRLDLVRKLGRASEYRDNETGRHLLRMSHAAFLLAKHLGWDEHACDLLLNAAPLHDVGKIGIPDGILLKPGPLTDQERDMMQRHTLIGGDILGDSDDELLAMARDIALSHHEKWDGSGYPRRLVGTDIPEAARIVAITDVFDALTSSRPYKQPWSVEAALDFMRQGSGKHFDPTLLAAFMEIVPEVQAIRDRFAEPVAALAAGADAAD